MSTLRTSAHPRRFSAGLLSLLLLLLSPLLTPFSAQTPPPGLLNSTLWFPPNLTIATVNTTTPTLVSWNNTRNSATLFPSNSSLSPPLIDHSSPPPSFPSIPSLLFNASSPLSTSVPWSLFYPSTVFLVVNVTQNCTFPTCALLSTSGKNRTGSLILSTSPSPTTPGWVVQLTVITSLSTWTALSSIPLNYTTWQVLAVTTTSLSNGSSITLRSPAGEETFPLLLAVNDTLPYDPGLRVNLSVGDPLFHGSIRDVIVAPSPTSLWSDDGDSVFAYFYSLYSLPTPPTRMQAPTVSFLNGTALLVQWTAPFSPTSVLISYQLRVIAITPTSLSTNTFIPTYNTLTSYQFSPLRKDNTTYSFALYASNLDYPLPPITTPLLYSTPVTYLTAPPSPPNITLLSPPLPSKFPNSYLTQGNNITLLVDFPDNTTTAGPLSATAPLQALALFYSIDGGGNWTFAPLPIWSFPIFWANLLGTITNLPPGIYWFKSMASNTAGGSNSSASPSGVGIGGAISSSAGGISGGGNATSSTGGSGGTGVVGLGNGTSATVEGTGSGASTVVTSAFPQSQLPALPTTLPATSLTSTPFNATTRNVSSSSSSEKPLLSSSHTSPSSSSRASSSVPSVSSASINWGSSTAASSLGSSAMPGPMSLDQSSSYSDTLIAGIIIGVFVSLLLLCILSYCCFCSSSARRKRQGPPTNTTSSVASPRPSPGLAPVPLASPLASPGGEDKAGRGGGRGRPANGRLDRRFGGFDHHDVELATVDTEWSEEEDGVHQMKDIQLPPPAINGQARK